MHELTELIYKDMVPALGVTEPGAIAFCVAKARSYTRGEPRRVHVTLNSGMYKNAFTCGIPSSQETGNLFAAALGFIAGDAEKGLQCLENVQPADNEAARKVIEEGRVTVEMSGFTSRIFIEATVETRQDKAVVTIRDTHTNITRIEVNGKVVLKTEEERGDTGEEKRNNEVASEEEEGKHLIHRYTLEQLLRYVNTVPYEEISFVKEAYRMNLALFEEGLSNPRTTFARQLLAMNGGKVFSDDERRTASLLCNGAIEARVLGLDLPAMSITGSGAHGIIATMPLYAVYKIHDLSEELLCRSTMLSYLICTYIKEYSGRLSAFCGCAIAAGSGMACGLVLLKGGGAREMEYTLNNMASSITGMICDGGNQGCTMKGVVATDAAFQSVAFAMAGVHIDKVHGINGATPEETMRNMGLIASPGMVGTEKTIVEIFQGKMR